MTTKINYKKIILQRDNKEYYCNLLKHTKTISLYKLFRKYHKDYSEGTKISLALNSDRVRRILL